MESIKWFSYQFFGIEDLLLPRQNENGLMDDSVGKHYTHIKKRRQHIQLKLWSKWLHIE